MPKNIGKLYRRICITEYRCQKRPWRKRSITARYDYEIVLRFLSESSVFCITFATIDWSSFFRYKGNFTLLSTVSTGCLMHCSRTITTSIETHFLFTSIQHSSTRLILKPILKNNPLYATTWFSFFLFKARAKIDSCWKNMIACLVSSEEFSLSSSISFWGKNLREYFWVSLRVANRGGY